LQIEVENRLFLDLPRAQILIVAFSRMRTPQGIEGFSMSHSVPSGEFGPAEPSGLLPHIFDRFFKDDSLKWESGSGLGLAISKHVVQAHGGEVGVTSQVGRFQFASAAEKQRPVAAQLARPRLLDSSC
jgi:nitrogen-specific signal transduction histidine kinase